VTLEPQKKRRTRILIGGAIAVLTVGLLLCAFVIARRMERLNGRIHFSKSSILCIRCGAHRFLRTRSFFGLDYNAWSDFTPPALSYADSNYCTHVSRSLGIRRRYLDLTVDIKPETLTEGFPDGDFFSTFPALREALSRIATTNIDQSMHVLSAILNLQEETNAPLKELLPVLSSENAELLKTALQIRFSSPASNVREAQIQAEPSLAFPKK
jgi:hypothetical protein